MKPLVPKALGGVTAHAGVFLVQPAGVAMRYASNHSAAHQASSAPENQAQIDTKSSEKDSHNSNERKNSVAEEDAELRLKLEGISGGGGEAGLELEDGQPVAMKRSVKEKMFRLI